MSQTDNQTLDFNPHGLYGEMDRRQTKFAAAVDALYVFLNASLNGTEPSQFTRDNGIREGRFQSTLTIGFKNGQDIEISATVTINTSGQITFDRNSQTNTAPKNSRELFYVDDRADQTYIVDKVIAMMRQDSHGIFSDMPLHFCKGHQTLMDPTQKREFIAAAQRRLTPPTEERHFAK